MGIPAVVKVKHKNKSMSIIKDDIVPLSGYRPSKETRTFVCSGSGHLFRTSALFKLEQIVVVSSLFIRM